MQLNFQEEVENCDPTTRASVEAEYEDVVIPYADEPLLASQQFMQEYNYSRTAMEKELRQEAQKKGGR